MNPDDGVDSVLDAAVVICSRERPALLADVVASVLAAAAGRPAELVVVDQSTAPNAAVAGVTAPAGTTLTYLHVPGRGVARSRNLGLRTARADVVVLLDDDMYVEPQWLEHLLRGRERHDRRSIARGRVLPAPPDEPGATVPAAALITLEAPERYRGRQDADVVPGANVALDRQLVLDLGGYDERLGPGTRYPAAEDNDLGWRLLEAGCELRHVPEAVVLHRAWRSRGGAARLRWDYGRGKGAFYAKHLSVRDRFILRRLLHDLADRVVRAIRAALRAPTSAAGELLYALGVVSGAAEWLIRERWVAALRR